MTSSDVARHYDQLDAFYRDIWGEHVHHGLWLRGDETREVAVRQLIELVADEAQIGPGTRVIDIGCGYGATARLLAETHAAEVTAITNSPAQHTFAIAAQPDSASEPQMPADARSSELLVPSSASIRAHLRPPPAKRIPPPHFLLGDWLENDLPAATFDTALAIESSEHMADKPRFFAQAHRVLRPGGRLIVCTWLAAEHPTTRQRRWLIAPIHREAHMAPFLSETAFHQLATAATFHLEHFQDLTPQIAPTWPNIVQTFLLKLLRHPTAARFLFTRHARNRTFALTTLRLSLAFRTGAMRYGIFTLVK